MIPAPTKPQVLARLGAEVVAADVDDTESLKRAFHGAYGAFCVTFFWNHFSPEKELESAKNMAGMAMAPAACHGRPAQSFASGPDQIASRWAAENPY